MAQNLIYGLQDPLTKELRYIGQSSVGLKRPKKSLSPNYNINSSHKSKWIRKLRSLERKPEIVILEILDDKLELNDAEIFWISYFKSLGTRLTNASPGGALSNPPPPRPKGYKHSKDTIQKMKSWKRPPLSEEQKQILRTRQLGKKFGPCKDSTKQKISAANTGKKRSEYCKSIMGVSKRKKIIDQHGNIFDSLTKAAEHYRIAVASVYQCARGMIKQTRGIIFRYL